MSSPSITSLNSIAAFSSTGGDDRGNHGDVLIVTRQPGGVVAGPLAAGRQPGVVALAGRIIQSRKTISKTGAHPSSPVTPPSLAATRHRSRAETPARSRSHMRPTIR